MSDTKRVTFTLPVVWILFIVFLVLQLTDHIDWPWYAVAAPLLIPIGLFGLILLGVGIVTFWANR